VSKSFREPGSRSTCKVNTTGWLKGLRVTEDGVGIVSHAGILRPGSAGSNTAADHLAVLDAAITALPPKFRRRLMVTCDGAGPATI
jgi:hypothetical protein